MSDVEKSDSGVWLNTQTNQVVNEAPVEGVQLVPPGGELTPDVVAAIEAAKASAPVVVEESVSDPEPPKAEKAVAAKKAK